MQNESEPTKCRKRIASYSIEGGPLAMENSGLTAVFKKTCLLVSSWCLCQTLLHYKCLVLFLNSCHWTVFMPYHSILITLSNFSFWGEFSPQVGLECLGLTDLPALVRKSTNLWPIHSVYIFEQGYVIPPLFSLELFWLCEL